MDYHEVFGKIAFYSCLGLLVSGLIHHILNNIQEKRKFPLDKSIWPEFRAGIWVLVFAFGIGFYVWATISIIDWLDKL